MRINIHIDVTPEEFPKIKHILEELHQLADGVTIAAGRPPAPSKPTLALRNQGFSTPDRQWTRRNTPIKSKQIEIELIQYHILCRWEAYSQQLQR